VSEAEARVGETLLDKWHLDALLGVGGMAAVYAATHRNGMRGAVKMLHRACSADETIQRRFLREGYIANKVAHPGAVRVLDDDVTTDGNAFLVMELLDGNGLFELADQAGGKLDVESVLRFTDRVLDVLASAHDNGIVHRDIKPENIFVTHDGRVKVLDFGIAGLAEPPKEHARATQTGTPMGTPAFMAPEQARGRWDLVGPQSDVWSAGAMMFTLLTGQLLFEDGTVAELLAALVTKPARSLAEAWPDAPPELVDVVDRALLGSLVDRWASARAMQQGVRDAYLVLCGAPMPAGPSDDAVQAVAPFVVRATPVRLAPTVSAKSSRIGGLVAAVRARRFVAMGLVGVLMVAVAFVSAQAREIPHGNVADARVATASSAVGPIDSEPAPVAPSSAPIVDMPPSAPLTPVVTATPVAPSAPMVSVPRRPRPNLHSMFDRRH
jgi:serine/threonine protein kinase